MDLRRHYLFFFNDTATTEIYTLSLHDALPILDQAVPGLGCSRRVLIDLEAQEHHCHAGHGEQYGTYPRHSASDGHTTVEPDREGDHREAEENEVQNLQPSQGTER